MKRGFLILLVALLLTALPACSCSRGEPYADEIDALTRYFGRFEEPAAVRLTALNKYEVSKQELYYYLAFIEYGESYELLVIWYPATRRIELGFFADMEAGLSKPIKERWDELRLRSPDAVYGVSARETIWEEVIRRLDG